MDSSDNTPTVFPDDGTPKETVSPGDNGLLALPVSHSSGTPAVRVLGEGGMGIVELLRQPGLDRDVAVKRIKPERVSAAADAALVEEAKLCGSLEHPNVVPVYQLESDADGNHRMVMKCLEGTSWKSLIGQAGPYDPEDRLLRHLEILIQVSNALHFAHSHGVVHRDVKPANVIVGSFGEVYLVDWGIAVRSGAGSDQTTAVAGTPAYMAPEQCDGSGAISPLTDVYQLGACLHEVLSGRPRHAGETMRGVLANAAISAPVAYDSGVPAELAVLANRATARDPVQRPASGLAFRTAIEDYLRHRGSTHLAQEAGARLEALRSDKGLSDEVHTRRLLTECRFGYLQALRSWEGNSAARSGLNACLEFAICYELDHRNVSAAAALLAELPERMPALEARLEELRRVRLEQERAAGELLAQNYQRGLGTQWKWRAHLAGTINFVLGGVMAFCSWRGQKPSTWMGVCFSLFAVMILTVVNVVAPRALIRTEANRKYLRCLWIATGLLASQQIHAHLRRVSVDDSLRLGLFLFLSVTLTLSVTLLVHVASLSISAAASLAVSFAFPGQPLAALATFFLLNGVWFFVWLGRVVSPEEGLALKS